jgi:hypothetical protein
MPLSFLKSRPARQIAVDTTVEADGSFRALLSNEVLALAREERVLVEAYSLGTTRHAPCRSKTIKLRVD